MKVLILIFLFFYYVSYSQSAIEVDLSINKDELLGKFEYEKNDTILILISDKLAKIYSEESKIDSALFFGKFCNKKLDKISLPNINSRNLIGIATLYSTQKEYDSAFLYFNKASIYISKFNDIDKSLLVLLGLRKQKALFKIGRYKESLSVLDSVAVLKTELAITEYNCLILQCYSELYYELGYFDEAIKKTKQIIKLNECGNDLSYKYFTLQSLYNKISQKDSCIKYIKKGIQESKKINNKTSLNLFYIELIDVLELEDTLEQRSFFEKIDTNYFKTNSEYFYYYLTKAEIYSFDNIINIKKSLLYVDSEVELIKLYYYLYNFYKKSDYKKALFFLEKYNKTNDLALYRTRPFLIEKVLLKSKLSDNKLNLIKQKKNQKIFSLIIYISLFIIVIIFFFFLQKQLTQKYKLKHEKQKLINDIEYSNSNLKKALFEIEKNIVFIENSKKEITEIRNQNTTNPQINNLYVRLNQYLSEIKRNNELQEKIKLIKEDVFKNLKHVKLTETEKKLITLIKLNLSSKEIAPLLNITENSVDKYRYRLKKKLKIDKKNSLKKFIKNL